MDYRVGVVAPVGRDGALIVDTLQRASIDAVASPDMAALCRLIDEGIGAAVLTEESLSPAAIDLLRTSLSCQPPWSDLPVVLLTSGGHDRASATWSLIKALDPVGNVSLLERPLRSITLVAAVQVALRSRRKQYETRSFHEQLENKVAERTAELQAMIKESEAFSYSISHDLRTPLRAIVSTSTMLMEDYGSDLPREARLHLVNQVKAGKRMAQLIDDLLDLSRLSRQPLKAQEFDLSALAEKVAQDLRASAPRACDFMIQDRMVAEGDPNLVELLLVNLMDNACKFSPHGGVVEVGRDDQGFFVRDEGIGFDMRYASKLFIPFERLVPEDQFPGTGIGLANVRRIALRHGGEVWAESSPGRGATFHFTLSNHSSDPG